MAQIGSQSTPGAAMATKLCARNVARIHDAKANECFLSVLFLQTVSCWTKYILNHYVTLNAQLLDNYLHIKIFTLCTYFTWGEM